MLLIYMQLLGKLTSKMKVEQNQCFKCDCKWEIFIGSEL